ncbi:MAG: mechanosensitive ion channel family protein [Clostridia bacterium]|nr:mechanosensitive ion channel family protein [Clostridia bacterium]
MLFIQNFFSELGQKIVDFFTNPTTLWAIGKFIIGVLIIFIGFKLVKKIVKKFINSKGMGHFSMTIRNFLGHVILIVAYVAISLIGVSIIGFNIAGLSALIASIGVTIGLAMQGSLSNIAGGIMVVGLKPFELGDYIDGAGVNGTVTDIGIFYTTLTTPDNKKVVVPNGALSNSVITNYSTHDTRRVDLDFNISLSADINLAKKVLISCAKADERVLEDPTPMAVVTSHGESAIKLQLRVWVRNEDYWDVKFALNEIVKTSFDQFGVEIPFPQLDVHITK